jgi:A/G-specific adenine glycosylase
LKKYPPLPERNRTALLEWFRHHGRDLPWRHTCDPYAITVSEFMLQQTRVSVVVDYFQRWMKRFPTVEILAAAAETEVLSLWQGLGYYSRARNLQKLARVIVRDHGGKFPHDLAALRRLPGIGAYTASAIRAFAFDLPAPVVDANVARVLSRWADFRDPVDTATGRSFLEEFCRCHQPEGSGAREWNSAVMELGALLCSSGVPDCLLCPVRSGCRAVNPRELPRKRPRAATTHLVEQRALILRGGRVWLLHSEGPRWRGLWLLPAWEEGDAGPLPTLCTVVYPITRYRVRMEVKLMRSVPVSWQGVLRSHRIEALAELPMAAPHRRAVARGLELVHSAAYA